MTKETETKSLPITKAMVWSAYKKVKANRGSAGIDGVSFLKFDQRLSNNLYKVWNRLASGCYFPSPVREVEIPKKDGKKRKLGIPTIADRIAQQVVKSYLEPRLEKVFDCRSYGYRPLKSAHQAVEEVRLNVRRYDWVIDLDIKGFFDNVSHELLLKALDRHVEEKWVKMYVQRWLEAPIELADGKRVEKQGLGTPQGGVISPLLANLFLHYAFDKWFSLTHPQLSFVRYADDIIVHCRTEQESEEVLASIKARFQECGLEAHPDKTKSVYCKDYRRKKKHFSVRFDFLGFSFQPRVAKSRVSKELFIVHDCAISIDAEKRINDTLKELKVHRWNMASLEEIAEKLNPQLRGWFTYYGKFRKWELDRVARRFHFRLVKWACSKYKRFRKSKAKAYQWLKQVRGEKPHLFYHWKLGYKTM